MQIARLSEAGDERGLGETISRNVRGIAHDGGRRGAATAGPFDDALAAAEQGDYVTALRLWRPLADQGDADAQYNLGVMYNNGDGVPQDYAEAMKWHRKAADQGNGNAQFHLGFMYDHGRGMPQSSAEAAKWYRLAANQGIAIAQFKLGIMYHDGQGCRATMCRRTCGSTSRPRTFQRRRQKTVMKR